MSVFGSLNWTVEAWVGSLLMCGFLEQKMGKCLLWLVLAVVRAKANAQVG